MQQEAKQDYAYCMMSILSMQLLIYESDNNNIGSYLRSQQPISHKYCRLAKLMDYHIAYKYIIAMESVSLRL